jgi:hypothetical protein
MWFKPEIFLTNIDASPVMAENDQKCCGQLPPFSGKRQILDFLGGFAPFVTFFTNIHPGIAQISHQFCSFFHKLI